MLWHRLDTHIVIYVIKRRPTEVLGIFNESAGRMAISAVTLSELFHGAEKSAKVAHNLAVVEEFASLLEVLPYTAWMPSDRPPAFTQPDLERSARRLVGLEPVPQGCVHPRLPAVARRPESLDDILRQADRDAFFRRRTLGAADTELSLKGCRQGPASRLEVLQVFGRDLAYLASAVNQGLGLWHSG